MKQAIFFLKIFSALTVSCFLLAPYAFPEAILLKSGKRMDAAFMGSTGNSLKVDFQGKVLFYRLDLIESIDGVPPEVFFLERYPGPEVIKGFFCRDVDYGLDTDLIRLVSALQREIPLRQVLWKLRSIDDVTRDLLLGGLENRYELIFPGQAGQTCQYDYDQAVKEFRQLISLDPYSAGFFFDRAASLSFTRSLLDELARHLKILEQDPYDAESLYRVGLLYYSAGAQTMSLPYFEKLIRINGYCAEGYGFMGLAYYAGGERERGRRALQRACSLFSSQGDRDQADKLSSLLCQLP